jgi:3-isopropylmalate/(R)-2-methylmalate dehydratase small subunit
MTPPTDTWTRSGKAWVFPDEYVNTDAIMPRAGFELPEKDQAPLVLASIRPGWAMLVKPGDILVVGRGFGSGSSRPAPLYIGRLGIAAIVGESVGEIFFRNCVSYAVPVLECPGVLGLVTEGDEVAVDIEHGTFVNRTTGATARGAAMPDMLLETIAAGGTQALLRREGYV